MNQFEDVEPSTEIALDRLRREVLIGIEQVERADFSTRTVDDIAAELSAAKDSA
ncbi:MAG: hypothetical protein ACREH3_05775 [Geminicoccales bacterium]